MIGSINGLMSIFIPNPAFLKFHKRLTRSAPRRLAIPSRVVCSIKIQACKMWAYHRQGSFPAGLRQEVHGYMQVLALGQVGVAALAPVAGLGVGGQLLHP